MLQIKQTQHHTDFKTFIQELRSFRKKRPDLPLSRCIDSLLTIRSEQVTTRIETPERS